MNISGQLEPPLQEGAERGGEDRDPQTWADLALVLIFRT